jgi:hypothetical protein
MTLPALDNLVRIGQLKAEPCNKMKLVQAWLEIHREEIAADWSLAVRGLPIEKIKPLE